MAETAVRAGREAAPRGVSCYTGPIATCNSDAHAHGEDFKPPKQLPAPVPLSRSNRVAGLQMPGEGSEGEKCGTVKSVVACSTGCGAPSTSIVPHSCKRPTCPTCSIDWLNRAAVRADERMRAAQALFLHRDARHFSFSPPQAAACAKLRRDGVKALSGMYRALYAMLRENGIKGGIVVFHPWRCSAKCGEDANEFKYRSRTRYLGPHFHVVGFGFFKPTSARFFKETGWIYKNQDDRECRKCHAKNAGNGERCYKCRTVLPDRNLRRTVWYLLEHCGLNVAGKKTKDAIRYYGTVHQLRQPKDERYNLETELKCSCGAVMHEHEPKRDDPTTPGEMLGIAYEIVQVRIYYRGKRARRPKGAPDRWYNVATEDPANQPRQIVLGGAAA